MKQLRVFSVQNAYKVDHSFLSNDWRRREHESKSVATTARLIFPPEIEQVFDTFLSCCHPLACIDLLLNWNKCTHILDQKAIEWWCNTSVQVYRWGTNRTVGGRRQRCEFLLVEKQQYTRTLFRKATWTNLRMSTVILNMPYSRVPAVLVDRGSLVRPSLLQQLSARHSHCCSLSFDWRWFATDWYL